MKFFFTGRQKKLQDKIEWDHLMKLAEKVENYLEIEGSRDFSYICGQLLENPDNILVCLFYLVQRGVLEVEFKWRAVSYMRDGEWDILFSIKEPLKVKEDYEQLLSNF